MSNDQLKVRKAVTRYQAQNYLLISLVAFGVTVVSVRVFLQLTGFPQIGGSVLHIAHALWGALLLFIAVFLPLLLANRWAIQASALLSGIGIGLFIDEVGKFITQTNDYFFPPALPLIYGFFLLIVLVYLLFRRPRQEDPRKAMYHILEVLQDVLDGDLDTAEEERLEARLAIAEQSEREEIVSLANAVGYFLQNEKRLLSPARPDFWKRTAMRLDEFGRGIGRRAHHGIISGLLILWIVLAIGALVTLALVALVGTDVDSQISQSVLNSSELTLVQNPFWFGVLIVMQLMLAGLVIIAAVSWLTGNEERGLKVAIFALLLSLVALQPFYFYLAQFATITGTLMQFALLLILLAYHRWYSIG